MKPAAASAPADRRGGRLGHLVAGPDQPVHPAVGREGALADREHARIGGAAPLVDRDAAALADHESAVAGEPVARTHARGEHHEVRGEFGAVGEAHAGHGAVGAGDDLPRAGAGVDGQAEVPDGTQQRRAAALVDLHGHQPRCELHDVRGQSEALERARRFQPQQPAADHRAGGRPRLRVLLDGEQVLDGPVDEAALGVPAGHRRHEGGGAGGEDQGVVGDGQAGAGRHRPRRPVDRPGRVAEVQFDAVLGDEPGVGQREFVRGAAREVRGEPDPVVSRTGLLTEHDHPVRRGQPALGQRLQEALADHAVTDEHDRGGVRGHREPPSSGCGAAACGQDPAVPAPVTTGRAFEVMPAACDAGVTRSHRRGFPGGTLISAGAGTGCEGPAPHASPAGVGRSRGSSAVGAETHRTPL